MIEEEIRVFISYASTIWDEYLCKELEKHLTLLKKQGLISIWHRRNINAGTEWMQEVNMHLDAAHIILLLVSADFLSSDYCYSIEMKRAIDRHNSGEAHIIPVILRPVDWKDAPFGQLQALPKNGKSITGNNGRYGRDKAFLEVTLGIREVIEQLKISKQGQDRDVPSKTTLATHSRNPLSKKSVPQIANPKLVEVQYQLYSSYLRGTELQRDKLAAGGRRKGEISQLEAIAAEIGEDLHAYFLKLIPQQRTTAQVDIDKKGTIRLNPPNALVLFYAFPAPRDFILSRPSTDIRDLEQMQTSQMAWRLIPNVSSIPANPFSQGVKADNQYLEIRYEGYLPTFIPLPEKKYGSFRLELTPVLNQRIGVTDFLDLSGQPTEVSRIISLEIISALEAYPEVATYGYYDPSEEVFLRRPDIKYGNVILNPSDIAQLMGEMKTLDIITVSGEGRHLRRKELDIQYLIQGNYRIIDR